MFKILSIDGGGIRGVIPAKVLALVEEQLEQEGRNTRLCDYFDLICGTSTGSIIAIGLALGMSARDILRLYNESAAAIFPSASALKKLMRVAKKKSLYERQALYDILSDSYDKASGASPATLAHAHTRLCIPTYDLERNKVQLFRNYGGGETAAERFAPARDVALASSAAPGYFKAYHFDFTTSEEEGSKHIVFNKLIDNGVTGNTPTLIAWLEAVNTLHVPAEELAILSLGTGDYMFDDAPDEVYARYWFYHKENFRKKGRQLILGNLLLTAQSTYTDMLIRSIQASGQQPGFIYERLQYVFSSTDVVPFDTSKPAHLKAMEHFGQKLYDEATNRLSPFFQ